MRKTVYYVQSIPKDEYDEPTTTHYPTREAAIDAAAAMWDEMDYDTQAKRVVIACKAVMDVPDKSPETDDSWGDEGGVYGTIVVGPNILKEFRVKTKKRRK